MPLLFKVKVPLQRKLILVAMFGSGFFVMICTMLRAYYSLKSITDLPIALGWANREEFVATIVVCLPGIKPLFSNRTWFQSTRGSRDRTPGGSEAYDKHFSEGDGNVSSPSRKNENGKHFELSSVGWRRHPYGSRRLSSDASDEEVFIEDAHESRRASYKPKDIYVTKEYMVSSEDAHTEV